MQFNTQFKCASLWIFAMTIFGVSLATSAFADSITSFLGECDLIQNQADGSVTQTPQSFNLGYTDRSQPLQFTVDGAQYVVTVYKESELSPAEVSFGLSAVGNPSFVGTSASNREPAPGVELDFSVNFNQLEYIRCSGSVAQ